MSDHAIRIEKLSKKYRLGQLNIDLLSERLSNLLRSSRGRTRGADLSEFWALREVDAEIAEGEVVGIIGRNGAGKSTLLKVLSRLTAPTEGRATVRGRLASLLEVGTGFHPELTGRENIYLNGTILGMRRAEIDRKFDDIVAFSGVETFLDTPVKRYSSGMYVRLAFAVAAYVEADVLVVDEVLAVGDAEFQRRCLGKMQEVARGGRTVLFVSHNLGALRALCTTGLVLEKGRVVTAGNVEHCITAYEARNGALRGLFWRRPESDEGRTLVATSIAANIVGMQPHLALELDITAESRGPHKPAFVAIDVADASGVALLQAIPRFDGFITSAQQQHRIGVSMELPRLVPGRYIASVWFGSHMSETLDLVTEAIAFDIHDSPSVGRVFPHTRDHGFLVPASSAQLVGESSECASVV